MANDHFPKSPQLKANRRLFESARTAGKAAEENLKQLKRGLEELKTKLPPVDSVESNPADETTQTASPSASPVKKISRN